ncbi:MAG: signal peptide peptidase SppA [Alphaproteobacteria bacterium]|nr:signal peptide peptidase SppA [Alphaproteobacteria bacterium]
MAYFSRKRTLVFNPQPKLAPPSRLRRIGSRVFLWLKRLCMVVGVFIVGSFALSLLASVFIPSGAPSLPSKFVLVFPVNEPVVERPSRINLLNPRLSEGLSLYQLTETLEKAAKDKRVQGVVFSLRSNPGSLSQIQELRSALQKVKDAGKFTKIYSVSYGEEASGLASYYLASAFDEIWMQPIGTVAMEGFRAELPYIRETLDKVGAEPEFFHRKEYKSIMENMTDKHMSSYTRETYNKLLGNMTKQVVSAIATDRKVSEATVQGWVDKGMLTAEEAVTNKLIDRLDYSDVIIDDIVEKVTGKREQNYKIFVNIADYAYVSSNEITTKSFGKHENVAVVYASGPIVMGEPSGAGGLDDADIASARQLADILYDVAEADDIKGMVLRIDSPGGSPTASETIRRAILKVKDKGKPVYVSMGRAAASGGYWIAADADKIYATPATLTGSIGVAGGKFNLAKLWDKLGVNWESVSFGKNAGMYSFNKGFSPAQQERFEASLDAVYDNFITRVAEGRKMPADKVEALAKGQVYTGEQAKDVGLVDELGGLPQTLDGMAEKLGVKDRSKLNIVTLPKPESKLQKLVDLLSQQIGFYDWLKNTRARFDLMQSGVLALDTRLGF